jgi:hypothetical protein
MRAALNDAFARLIDDLARNKTCNKSKNEPPNNRHRVLPLSSSEETPVEWRFLALVLLLRTVCIGVLLACFGCMMSGVCRMPMRYLGMMPGFLVGAGLMVLGSFLVMLCRRLVMRSSRGMVLSRFRFGRH